MSVGSQAAKQRRGSMARLTVNIGGGSPQSHCCCLAVAVYWAGPACLLAAALPRVPTAGPRVAGGSSTAALISAGVWSGTAEAAAEG